MEALLALAPRNAGLQTMEPQVSFDAVEQAAHAADRCPVSCICSGGTNNCIVTGWSRFAD